MVWRFRWICFAFLVFEHVVLGVIFLSVDINYGKLRGIWCKTKKEILINLEDEEIYYHDVFDSEGRYIVKIPLRMRPFMCKRGKLHSIEEDEEGYLVVKRYRVKWKY